MSGFAETSDAVSPARWLMAFILDVLIYISGTIALAFLTMLLSADLYMGVYLVLVVCFIGLPCVFALLDIADKTPGRAAFAIWTAEAGASQPASRQRRLDRTLLKWLPMLPIAMGIAVKITTGFDTGYVEFFIYSAVVLAAVIALGCLAIFGPRRQTLHDIIAGTVLCSSTQSHRWRREPRGFEPVFQIDLSDSESDI